MKFFKMVKEIRSRTGELHFQRYAIFETPILSLYIHKIYKRDEDLHLHNHPWNFITMVLDGGYEELLPNGKRNKIPGTISWMSRNGYHKINQIIAGPVTTIFLSFGKWMPWGYDVNGNHVESNLYRKMKNDGLLRIDLRK